MYGHIINGIVHLESIVLALFIPEKCLSTKMTPISVLRQTRGRYTCPSTILPARGADGLIA